MKFAGPRFIISSVRLPRKPGWTVGAVKCTSRPNLARLLLPSMCAAKHVLRARSIGNEIFSSVVPNTKHCGLRIYG